MKNRDLILWILLIGLTLFGFFSSESNLGSGTLVLFLVSATAFKFLGVGFQFLELKRAHLFWKIGFIFLLSLYLGIVFVLA